MTDKNQNKAKKNSYIFTRETFGMTLMLFSAVLLFVLFTRSWALANVGSEICHFMYGTFGYGSVPVTALVGYVGFWLLTEKSIKVKPTVALSIVGCVLMLFFLFHAVTTRGYDLQSYGGYIAACYNNAAAGISGYTCGGVISAILVYPVAKFTTFIGAYIIFSVLFLLCGYLVFLTATGFKIGKISNRKVAAVTAVTDEAHDDSHSEELESEPVVDRLYIVNENSEIVDNRPIPQYEQEPVYERQPEYASVQDTGPREEDKYSQKNLGRKILFENGEFAAESYRRNMIFSEDSYFNHPVSSEADYLSSFSSNPAEYRRSETANKSYTESYQEEILNEPVAEIPSNYVYGESPVQSLNDEPSQSDYQQYDEPVESFDDVPTFDEYSKSIREPETFDEPEEELQQPYYAEPPVSERATFVERTRFTEPTPEPEKPVQSLEQPAPAAESQPTEPPKEESKPSSILSSLFGSDSVRGDRGRGIEVGQPRGEHSNQDLFDNDEVDLGEDVFNMSSRDIGARTERFERETRETDTKPERIEPSARTESSSRIEPPARPEPPASTAGRREVGFTAPSPERKVAPAEPPKEEKPVEKPKHVWKKYVRPSLDLLDDYPENNNVNTGEIEDNKHIIVETLEKFKIASEVANVTIGPAITRYDVIIADRTNVKRSLNYRDEIALALMKNNVNAYLNYAKGAISIEIPNDKRAVVGLKTMLASPKFFNSKPNSLTFGLGKNVEGEVICPDITKMPHLLVAGTTGSGKSICLSTLLISLLYKYGPEELRLILVDPKQVEFISYDKLPHLMINEIIYDVDKAIKALNWANKEMERRYTLFKEMTENGIATKNLDEYNAHLPEGEEKLPKVLIVLDEFGDLMLAAKKDIESRIIKLVQKARACGIHLILATQRPSVDCITGLIKSNLPTRIGFKVNSFADSSTIFDVGGAEKLLGKGDMYFRSTENPELTRIQGCFIDTPEVQKVTDFIKANNETYFDQDVSDFINKVEEPEVAASIGGDAGEDGGDAKIDDTFIKALKFCVTSKQASVSMIQRRFPVGYIKACKIIDWMENMNYITQSEGSKPRKVLLSIEEFVNIYGEVDD